ncbi:MAG: hypothetical protein HKN14_12660 [Marinicaulis sp.]|nr:hypothetical protein [Marinicaulis sp.]
MKLKTTLTAAIFIIGAVTSNALASDPIQLIPAGLTPIKSDATVTYLDSIFVKRVEFKSATTQTVAVAKRKNNYDALFFNASYNDPTDKPIFAGCVPAGFLPIVRFPLTPLPCNQIELFETRDGVITKDPTTITGSADVDTSDPEI